VSSQFKVGFEPDSALGERFPLANAYLVALESGATPFWAESRALRVLELCYSPQGLLRTWSEARFSAGRFGDFLSQVSLVPSANGGAK
jgi:hypothetical protein